MPQKPTPLLLIVAGGMGSILLSALPVQGQVVLSLVLPFALLAAALHDLESGFVVGVGISLLSGALTQRIDFWETLIWVLASGVAVLGYSTYQKNTNPKLYLVLFSILGTLSFEIVHDIYTGDPVFFREENFLGTNPGSGIRLVFNALITWGLAQYYSKEIQPSKK